MTKSRVGALLGLTYVVWASACTTRGATDDAGNAGQASGGARNASSGGAPSGGSSSGGARSPSGGNASSGGHVEHVDSGGGMGGQDSTEPGSGGARAGGGSGGSQPKVKKPELVTSGPNTGYFQEGKLGRVSAAATTSVQTDKPHQTMRGFGGSFTERGWIALRALSKEDRERALKLLFSESEGANLTWGRIPMGSDSHSRERFSYDDIESGTDYPLAHFSIERDLDESGGVIPYVREAQKARSDIRFWGSPWSPPPWMKDNNSYDGGAMKNTVENLSAYSQYFVKFVQAYAKEGIPVHHVFPQHEPDWVGDVPSSAWGPAGSSTGTTDASAFMGTFVADYLIPALSAAGLRTEVWFGQFSENHLCGNYWDNLVAAGGAELVRGVGMEWGCTSIIAPMRAANSDLVVMMTEQNPGNSPWHGPANSLEEADQDSFWKDQAPNNHNYGVQTWNLMKQWITTAEVNAYSAWHMVLDDQGFGMETNLPWPQNSLLAVDVDEKKLIVTPAYYVFRHVSQFVEEGAVRLDATGGDAMAFQNPNGGVVAVLYNEEALEAEVAVAIDDEVYGVTIPGKGWATLNVPPQ